MSKKVGTNLFGKGQRVISDAYRKGYDNIKWGSPACECDRGDCDKKKCEKELAE